MIAGQNCAITCGFQFHEGQTVSWWQIRSSFAQSFLTVKGFVIQTLQTPLFLTKRRNVYCSPYKLSQGFRSFLEKLSEHTLGRSKVKANVKCKDLQWELFCK